jgi:hypothetical protein
MTATTSDIECRYHWALMVGPKIESGDKHGTRHHAKETITPNGVQWIYEKKDVSLAPTISSQFYVEYL